MGGREAVDVAGYNMKRESSKAKGLEEVQDPTHVVKSIIQSFPHPHPTPPPSEGRESWEAVLLHLDDLRRKVVQLDRWIGS